VVVTDRKKTRDIATAQVEIAEIDKHNHRVNVNLSCDKQEGKKLGLDRR
jgi:hypothetical protein